MSGQNTLITCANDNEVKRPSGTIVSRQFYRDKSAQGLGVYKAMDENGNIEIIGGPGSNLDFNSFEIDLSFSDFQPDGTTSKTINCGQIPDGYVPYFTIIQCTQQAVAAGMTGVLINVKSKATNSYTAANNSVAALGNPFVNTIPNLQEWSALALSLAFGASQRMKTLSSPLDLECQLSVNGCVINDLTAGTWKATIFCVKRTLGKNIIFPLPI